MRPEHNCKVLLIEESRFQCLFYVHALKSADDVSLKFATSLGNALQFSDEYLPEVILLLLEPGEEAGRLELLEALRENAATRDVPAVMLCEGALDDEERFAAAGVNIMNRDADNQTLARKLRACSLDYRDRLKSDILREASADEDLGPSRVLMIDDSKMICQAIGQKLADEDAVFETCNDPTLALDVAREFRPTVILLDLEMPKITGFDLLPVLRDDPLLREVPVIVLSAISEPQTKARAFKLGANDYAEK